MAIPRGQWAPPTPKNPEGFPFKKQPKNNYALRVRVTLACPSIRAAAPALLPRGAGASAKQARVRLARCAACGPDARPRRPRAMRKRRAAPRAALPSSPWLVATRVRVLCTIVVTRRAHLAPRPQQGVSDGARAGEAIVPACFFSALQSKLFRLYVLACI